MDQDQAGAAGGASRGAAGGDSAPARLPDAPAIRSRSPSDAALLEPLRAAATGHRGPQPVGPGSHENPLLAGQAVDAAMIGTFDWEAPPGVLTADRRMVLLFGFDPDAATPPLPAFQAQIHPQDRQRSAAAFRRAIRVGDHYDLRYRLLLPDGRVRWLAARGRAVRNDSGKVVRLLGACFEITEAQDDQAQVSQILETLPAGFYSVDRQWRFVYVNAAAEAILGASRTALLGTDHWHFVRASPTVRQHHGTAMDSGQPVTFQCYYPAPLDGWFEVRAWPTPEGLSVYLLDISTRRAAEQATEQTAARWALLAEITAELSGTLDGEEGMGRLAQLVVPALADWCVVTIVDEDGHGGTRRALRDVGWWHADPRRRSAVDRFCAVRVASLTGESLVDRVVRTGHSLVVARDAGALAGSAHAPGEAQDLITALAPGSMALFPLRGRGQTVGVLTLFNDAPRGPHTAQDLVTAAEVADRAGLALDNARLYHQQRRLAEALQRSLLTPPPPVPGMTVAVRYTPAAAAAQVGGDWYDVFCQPGGASMFAIGDVVGHDSAAAGAMGQLRALLRGIAACTGDGPADVLISVDQAMATLQLDTTATVVVAVVEQTDRQRAEGTGLMRWSNAGHPPPMLVSAQGLVQVLGQEEADILLGFDPQTTRTEWSIALDQGDTVLFFTDGLVERRGQSLDDGMGLLRTTLAELVKAGVLALDELCEEVLARLLPAQSEDDVALIMLRLHPHG